LTIHLGNSVLIFTAIVAILRTYENNQGSPGVGVKPDVEVSPTREDLVTGRDVVLERAVEMLME
jgi:C-terminal processing protease CtpA/Prc